MPQRHGSSKVQQRWREKWAKRIPFWSTLLMEWLLLWLFGSCFQCHRKKKEQAGGKGPAQNRTTRLNQNLAYENKKRCRSMIDQKKRRRKLPSAQQKKNTKHSSLFLKQPLLHSPHSACSTLKQQKASKPKYGCKKKTPVHIVRQTMRETRSDGAKQWQHKPSHEERRTRRTKAG